MYSALMAKTPDKTLGANMRFTLGRAAFAKISAVEGICLSADMEQRFRDFDRQGVTASDRRKSIVRMFDKGR